MSKACHAFVRVDTPACLYRELRNNLVFGSGHSTISSLKKLSQTNSKYIQQYYCVHKKN